jgi:hypothetical protein
MCQSINVKVPLLSRKKVRLLLTKEAMQLKSDIAVAVKGLYYASTTDAWTSNNNMSYSTCTIHFIDRRTWTLHHFALGIFKKTGTSKAEDDVSYCKNI